MGPVPGSVDRTRLSLRVPEGQQGLVGYRSVFSSDTRGTGFMHRAFLRTWRLNFWTWWLSFCSNQLHGTVTWNTVQQMLILYCS
ncbi:unnamed protein product [Prunus brigantina]